MNFSEEQRIGALGELDVERLFTSWGWIVGKDKIDAGYDLCVEPDRRRFGGRRFLVQVKGTASAGRRSAVAPVSRKRLRDYHNSALPVLIIRATGDGQLRWLHAQPWCRDNLKRLSGDGDLRVPIPQANNLHDEAAFSDRLERAFAFHESVGFLTEAIKRQETYLSSLDDRLAVSVKVSATGAAYTIVQVPGKTPVDTRIQLRPSAENRAASAEKLDEHHRYGMPIDMPLDAFSITGSPVFQEIGADTEAGGTVNIARAHPRSARLSLVAGPKYTPFLPSIEFDATVTTGNEGFSVLSQGERDVFRVQLRVRWPEGESKKSDSDFKFGLDIGCLRQHPLRSLHSLNDMGVWAERALQEDRVVLSVDWEGGRANAPMVISSRPHVAKFLGWMQTLSKAHQVLKFIESDMTVPEGAVLSEDELQELNIVHALLKGERVEMSIEQLTMDEGMPEIGHHSVGVAITEFSLTLFGLPVGSVSVALTVRDYLPTRDEAGKPIGLSKGQHGTAFMSYWDPAWGKEEMEALARG